MKATNTRRPLHQQAAGEQQGPFFNKANDDMKKKDDAFFQTKLAVGEKDDKHEKEADKVADKVQKKAEEKEKPEVQKKGEDKDKEADKGAAGQAAAPAATGPKGAAAPDAHKDKSPAHKEATGGNVKHGKDQATDKPATAAGQPAAAEHKDKAPDPKSAAGPAAQAGKDKEPPKGAAQQMTPKEEDSKMVSRKEAEQDQEPAVQKMSDGDKKEEDKTKVNKKEDTGKEEKDATIVNKEEAPKPGPAPVAAGAHKVSLEERIKKTKGKGQALPDEVKSFLEAELGADFSEVVIHTDSEAVAMNKELNALAFTNGFDIYFNAGQYRPDSKAGQKLLAHELTHVMQQTGVSKVKKAKGK